MKKYGTLTLAIVAVLLCAIALGGAARAHTPSIPAPLWDTGTFSILGFDPATGEIGGAVQSRVFSVGNGVLWADAEAGVAATQAIVDVGYGPKALALLRKRMKPGAIIQQILKEDPDPLPETWTKQGRQFAVCTEQGPKTMAQEYLLTGHARD